MLVRGVGAEGGKVVRAPVDFTVYARIVEAALGLSSQSAPEIVQKLSTVR
jgi:hypothetical protein